MKYRKYFFFAYLPLMLLLAVLAALINRMDRENLLHGVRAQEVTRLDTTLKVLTEELQYVRGDLLYLAQQQSAKAALLATDPAQREQLRNELAQRLSLFAGHKPMYEQLRILDLFGQEWVRVDASPSGPKVVANNNLQNKSDRYYFRSSRALKAGEIYVSPLDLNVEHNAIEQPLNPTIRFATPIIADSGQRLGYMILNYAAKPLLARLRSLAFAEGGQIWLLNKNGYFLLGPSAQQEWGFMYPQHKDSQLGQLYPSLWNLAQSQLTSQRLTADGLYTLNHWCGFKTCNEDSLNSLGAAGADDSDLPWTLMSVVSAQGIAAGFGLASHWQWQRGILFVMLAIGLLSGFYVWRLSNSLRSLNRSEQAARQSESHFRTLLAAAPDPIFVINQHDKIVLSNQSAAKLFGYQPEQLQRLSINSIIDARQRAELREAPTPHAHLRLQLHRQDDSIFPAEVSLTRVDMSEGEHWIVIVRDVSERERLEAQLRQSQKLQAVGQLTGGIAHDFNNLLTIMIGNLELLKRNIGGADAAPARVETALKAALSGADLTKRLLAFARKQVLTPQPLDLKAAIIDVLPLVERTMKADIRISLNLPDDLPTVYVDPSELENCIINLAINARDAMPNGGSLVIEAHSQHLEDKFGHYADLDLPAGDYVQLTLSDSGTGIAPEVLERVFEPFFTTKEKGKGSGLGLAMIYGFIRQSKGDIRIYSELGHGTSIHIYLPVSHEPLPAVIRDNFTGDLRGHGQHILVVDDEEAITQVAQDQLQALGYCVDVANSADAALDLLQQREPYALIISDVVMPGGLSGFEFLREARQRGYLTPFLFASGFSEEALRERVGRELRAPLIQKPFRKQDLAEAVSALVQQVRPSPSVT